MKSMSNNNNGSNNNWLGFSLSPHMKMEAASDPQHHHQYHHETQTQTHAPTADSVSAAVPTSFYLSTSLFNSSGICYGVGENGGFHSPLSVMPLKSDGSLCIMEALTRSQPEGLLPA
jgi:AP2-like factor (ANT lineage)